MRNSNVPSREQRDDLRQLDRECERFLGLDKEHDIRRKLARLDKWWDPQMLEFVKRAMRELRAQRERCEHAGRYIPAPGILNGDLNLGEVLSPFPGRAQLALRTKDLIFNTLVVGLIGTGKTHLVRRVLTILAMSRPDVRIIVFDPNNSYVDVCVPPAWVSLNWEDCRTNRLCAPKGYPYALWKNEVVDALCRGELLHSKYLLAKRLDELFERADAPGFDDGISPIPCLFDLREDLAARKCRPGSKDEAYRQSALNVLDGRLRGTGSVYDCARGMEAMLSDTRVRVSTLGLSPLENLVFVITGFLHYIYRQRCASPLLGPPRLHTLVVVEEAQTLLERRKDAPIAMYQEMLLRSRSLGLGYVFVAQDLARIDPVVFSGITNYFVFAQSSAANKRAAQHILDLDREETALLGELSRGECFVKFTGNDDWPLPFVSRIAP